MVVMNIELGGGENRRKPAWKQQDVRSLPGIDFVCQAWELDAHVDPGTVRNLYTRHMFEHLTFAQGRNSAASWFRALAPGGRLEIILPNLDFHVRQLYEKRNIPGTYKNDWKKHGLAGIYGWQREGADSLWDVHKSGYNQESLRELMTSVGFVLEKDASRDRDLHMVFVKADKNMRV